MPFISIQSAFQPLTVVPPLISEQYLLTAAYYSDDAYQTYDGSSQVTVSADGSTLFHRVELADRSVIQVYRDVGGVWTLQDVLESPELTYEFGNSGQPTGYGDSTNFACSADGNYLIVSDRSIITVSPDTVGVSHIFHYDGVSWGLQQTVQSDPLVTETLVNTYGACGALVGMSSDGSRVFVVNLYERATGNPHPFDTNTYSDPYHPSDPFTDYKYSQNWFILTFDRVGTTWTFSGVIRPPLADGSSFNSSGAVTMSGNGQVIAVEADIAYGNYDATENRYQISIYEWDTGAWVYRDAIIPPDADGPGSFSAFSMMQLSANGNTLVFVADYEIPENIEPYRQDFSSFGQGLVFERSGNNWIYACSLKPNEALSYPTSAAISADGQTIAIGRADAQTNFIIPGGGTPNRFDNAVEKARIDVYKKVNANEWKHVKVLHHPHDYYQNSIMGWSLGISSDGNRIVTHNAGAPWSADPSPPDFFNAYCLILVYDLLQYQEPSIPFWNPTHRLQEDPTVASAQYAYEVNISSDGNTMVVTKLDTPTIDVYVKSLGNWTLQSTLTSPVVGATAIASPQISADGNTIVAISSTAGTLSPIAFERTTGVWNVGLEVASSYVYQNVVALSDDGNRIAILANPPESNNLVVIYTKDTPLTTWTEAYAISSSVDTIDAVEINTISTLSLTNTGTTLLITTTDTNFSYQYGIIFEDTGSPAIGTAWARTHSLVAPIDTNYSTEFRFGSLGKISADGSTIAIVDNTDVSTRNGVNYIAVYKANADGDWIVNDILRTDIPSGWAAIQAIDLSADGNTLIASTTSNGNDAAAGGNIHSWAYLPVVPGNPTVKNWVKSPRTTVESPYSAPGDLIANSIACTADGLDLVASGRYIDDLTVGSPVRTDVGTVLVFNRASTIPSTARDKWQVFQTRELPENNVVANETRWGAPVAATRNGLLCATTSSTGLAYTFTLLQGNLKTTAYLNLTATQTANLGTYGISMSDDEVNAVIAVTGTGGTLTEPHLYIFEPGPYRFKLTADIASSVNTELRHVAVSGDGSTVYVSVYDTNALKTTSVQKYTKTLGTWSLAETITPNPVTYATRENFGAAMACSYNGQTLVVGAPSLAGDPSIIYVYEWNGSSMAETFAGNASGTAPNLFGNSVSINSTGTRIAVGDPTNDRAYIFNKVSNVWSLDRTFNIRDDYAGLGAGTLEFGYSVALSGNGNLLVVGAPVATQDAGTAITGLAAVYKLVSSVWRLEDVLFDDARRTSDFGRGVNINQDGTIIYVGAPKQEVSGYYIAGDNGLLYVWTNRAFEIEEASRRQTVHPIPTIRYYVSKRLVNVNEPFDLVVSVTNERAVTLTNLTILIYIAGGVYVTNVVDVVDAGTVVDGTPNTPGPGILPVTWTIPTLAPNQTLTFTRTAEIPSTDYGRNVSIDIFKAYSDQAPQIDPDAVSDSFAYWAASDDPADTTQISPTTVASMSKAYFYTGTSCQSVAGNFAMCSAWTNLTGTDLATDNKSTNDISTYYRTLRSTAGGNNNTTDGHLSFGGNINWELYSRMKPTVAPNGKFVVFNYSDYSAPSVDGVRAFERDLVGTIKPTDEFYTAFPNPGEEPTPHGNCIAISPDADATYMAYCENTLGGLKVYKKLPNTLQWELMAALPGAPDGVPTYACWSQDGQYLGVTSEGGSRAFYIWKLNPGSPTDSWTDLSFATTLNGLSDYGVIKFSKDINNKILFFVAPRWKAANFDARTSASPSFGGVDNTNEEILVSAWATGSAVRYSKEGRSGSPNITGLTDGNTYYVRKISANWSSFYPTKADALADTNKIGLTAGSTSYYQWFFSLGTGKTYIYELDKADDSIVELPFVVCFKGNQTEADYSGGGANGSFVAGTGYTANTVIKLQEGTRVTINTVGGSGEVLTFTIETRNNSKRGHRSSVAIPAITGSGTGFSLTSNTNNEEAHGMFSSYMDATWSDDYLVIARSGSARPPSSIDDSAHLEIFHRSGTDGEVFDHFTGTVSDVYPVGSDQRGVTWTDAAKTGGTSTITSASANFLTSGIVAGDRIYLKSGNEQGTYTVAGVSASSITVSGIGTTGANAERESRPIGSWIFTESSLVMTVVSDGTFGAPRSVSFNHDGTYLAIGGRSNRATGGVTILWAYIPSRVYAVSGTSFTRLTDPRFESGFTGEVSGTVPLGMWERYVQWIDVWPGVFSGPYYNSTDWSIE